MENLVYMKNINKSFPGVKALDNVNFELKRGEIHALLGENGAGKTTLMKILAGLYRMDSGEIYVEGRRVEISSVKEAVGYGIVMVNQYPQLIDDLTVSENIVLSISRYGLFKRVDSVNEYIRRISKEYEFNIDPNVRISELSFSERQRVELIKAILLNARVIILDEPTTLLTSREKKLIYQFMRKEANKGKGIVLITHKIDEALEVSDRITILRGGKVITTLDTYTASYNEILKYIFDIKIITKLPRREKLHTKRWLDDVILALDKVYIRNDSGEIIIRDVSLKINKGEIYGLAGIAGNGQIEFAETVAGLRKPASGKVIINGLDLYELKPAYRRRLIGYIPDRIIESIVLDMPIYENILLRYYREPEYRDHILINYDGIKEFSSKLIKEYNIVARGVSTLAGHLSGGNLQKLAIGRELSSNPEILIVMNPTKALDYASSMKLYEMMIKYRNSNGSILLISEDLEEIFKLSDRIGVISNGRIYDLGYSKDLDVDTVEKHMVSTKFR